jgi:hypothetical protein
VPLLFVGPRAPAGRRVRRLVQSVDLAPTLLEIAGTPESKRPRMSGRSLLPLLAGADGPYPADAYAEAYGRQDRTLYRQTAGRLLQLIRSEPAREAAGTWVTRSIAFDHPGAELRFRAQAFQCTRPLEVSVDGRLLERAAVGVDGHWFRFALPERDGIRRVRLSSPSCTSPASLGESSDARCLSFRVEGLRLVMWQLFDLTRARRSGADLSRESPELVRELDRGLQGFAHKPVAPAARTALQGELAERLRALGYIQ